MPPNTTATSVINPFQRPTIEDPRETLNSVESINKEALDAVLARFAELEAQPLPRIGRGPLAVVMTSQEAGCGKSHLLGRIWKELDDRATLIFLRANQDQYNLWTRMLERTVQELEYPDRATALVASPEEPSQLDSIARHIIASLIIKAVESGAIIVEDPERDLEGWRNDPVKTLGKARYCEWLLANLDGLQTRLQVDLHHAGLRLDLTASAWLRVLIRFTATTDLNERATAAKWIKGLPLEEDEAELLGLRATDLPLADESETGRNERSFRRLADLCKLASFFRPFVFAFDQTEMYGKSRDLAKAFGAMVARLQAECINQLTLVTGNQDVWKDNVAAHFDRADSDRFDPRQVAVKGVTEREATALIENYLIKVAKMTSGKAGAFAQRAWLKERFKGAARIPARAILNAASKEFQTAGPITLAELYEEYRLRLLSTPRATDYDGAVLSWVLSEGMSKMSGVQTDAGHHSARGYLAARWRAGDTTLYFVLTESSNWKHWEAILREYEAAHCVEASHGRKCQGVALWHTSFGKPKPAMKTRIDAAKDFHLDTLDQKDMAELLAGQTVHAEIAQGDQTHFTQDELLTFLAEKWAGWKGRFVKDSKPGGGGGEPPVQLLSLSIQKAVRSGRSLAWPVLERRLQSSVKIAFTLDDVLLACQPLADEITIFKTPVNRLFLWTGKKST